MKKTVLILGLLLGCSSFAGNCFQQLAENEGQIIPTAGQIACAYKGEAAMASAQHLLCSSDLSDVSAQYKSYMQYKTQRQVIAKAFLTAPNDRRADLQMKLMQAENDWILFGSKQEISTGLMTLIQISSLNCGSNAEMK